MAKSKFIKHSLKKITKSKPFMALMSTIIHAYARLVWKTGRWKICGLETMIKIWKKDQSIILIGWHNRVPMMPMLMEHAQGPMKALVSLHNDGRMIAGFLENFNIGIISGSSNNNAKGAAVNIMHTLQENTSVTIIPDGPRGPRMKMSMSPVYFAAKTGKPVFVMTYSQKGAKIISKAWDKMLVPVPFSEGIYYISEPFYVPQDADDQTLEQYRRKLETIANILTWQADREMGLPRIEPQTEAKSKRHKK